MTDTRLYLVAANKSRPSGEWSDDDFDVRSGSPAGPVVGRIFKQAYSPSGSPWFWGLNLYPAVPADSGTEATREAAMAAFRVQWEAREQKVQAGTK